MKTPVEIPFSKSPEGEEPFWTWIVEPKEQGIGSLACACVHCGKYHSMFYHNVKNTGEVRSPMECEACGKTFRATLLDWPEALWKRSGTSLTELIPFEELHP